MKDFPYGKAFLEVNHSLNFIMKTTKECIMHHASFVSTTQTDIFVRGHY